MCTFCITYEDGKYVAYSHVKSVSYVGYESNVIVQEPQLCTHMYPIRKNLWLQSDDGIFCANGDGIRSIEVSKE